MAERACILDAVDPVDYTTLTEEIFDWVQWIDQESRRRYFAPTFKLSFSRRAQLISEYKGSHVRYSAKTWQAVSSREDPLHLLL
jgi:hypothetical protein